MKTLQLFVLLMTIQLLVICDIQAQTYDTGDTTALGVIRDNNFVEDDPLNWSDPDPANWLGVAWDDNEPKRVTGLSLERNGDDIRTIDNGTEWGLSFGVDDDFNDFSTGISSQLVDTIDFSPFTQLEFLNITDQTGIDVVNMQGLTELKYLGFDDAEVNYLDLSSLPSLIYANLSSSGIDSLDISNCPSLLSLRAPSTSITYLNLSGNVSLRHLNLKNFNTSSLDVSGLTDLMRLSISNSNVEEIIGEEDLVSFRGFSASGSPLTGSLDVSNFDYSGFYKFSIYDGGNVEEIIGLDNLLDLTNIVTLNVDDNALSLQQAVAIEDFQGNATRRDANADDQVRYGGFTAVVPLSLDFSNEALITTSEGDIATTFTLFNDENTQIDQNTTGLFEITGDEDADVYYVTMENSGVSLTTNNITVLASGVSILSASLSGDDFEAFIGQSDSQTLTVENAGDEALEITDITLPHEDFSIDATTATIAVGASQDFTVTFAPSKDSVYVGNLEIVSDADAGDNTFELTGIGLDPASVISASLSSSDFGTVLAGETSSPQTMTVENLGVLALEITDIIVPDAFSVGATTATIGAGESSEFEVTFSPNNTVSAIESYEGVIEIETDADQGGRFLGVSGTGIALSIISTAIDATSFGEVAIGSTQSQTLTITNASAVTINVSDIAVPEGFTIDATTATIAGSSSATFTVTLTPTEETTYSGDIVVTSDASGGVSSVAVSGTGVIVLGIEDLMNQVASLYPNPAENGIIQLDGYFNELELSVFSLAGREVKSFLINGTNNQIDLSDIRTGTYVVASPDMSFYQKVIKK